MPDWLVVDDALSRALFRSFRELPCPVTISRKNASLQVGPSKRVDVSKLSFATNLAYTL